MSDRTESRPIGPWQGTVLLTTPRLLLRTFRASDLPLYAAMNADPEVTRYVGGPQTASSSDEIAEWAEECYAEEGIGLLAVERREDGVFLGMCGLHHLDWFPDELEIAWRLGRDHWGQGYATEAASAWLDHAFSVRKAPHVISAALRENVRSLAVMRRLGMELRNVADVEEGGASFRVDVHCITRAAWERRRPAAESLKGADDAR